MKTMKLKLEKVINDTKVLQIMFAVAMLLIALLISLIIVDQKNLEKRLKERENKQIKELRQRVIDLEAENQIYKFDIEQIKEFQKESME